MRALFLQLLLLQCWIILRNICFDVWAAVNAFSCQRFFLADCSDYFTLPSPYDSCSKREQSYFPKSFHQCIRPIEPLASCIFLTHLDIGCGSSSSIWSLWHGVMFCPSCQISVSAIDLGSVTNAHPMHHPVLLSKTTSVWHFGDSCGIDRNLARELGSVSFRKPQIR